MTYRFAALILTAALALSACGFSPVHTTNATAKAAFAGLSPELATGIAVDDKEAAFWLQNAIKTRTTDSATPRTILRLSPRAARSGIGISGDDIATRYDVGLNVDYELIDAKSGQLLDRGSVRSVSTFAASNDPYALTAAEKALTRELADDAADRVLSRVARYFADPKNSQSAK